MKEKMIGFIGAGNMGSAMIGGICQSKLITPEQIIASSHTAATAEKIKNTYGILTTTSNTDVAKISDILFIAIKPYQFAAVLPVIADSLKKDCIIVSVAAGQSIASIEAYLGTHIKLVRAMPNTPALVGESMSALCSNQNVKTEELTYVKQLFECFGKLRCYGIIDLLDFILFQYIEYNLIYQSKIGSLPIASSHKSFSIA